MASLFETNVICWSV